MAEFVNPYADSPAAPNFVNPYESGGAGPALPSFRNPYAASTPSTAAAQPAEVEEDGGIPSPWGLIGNAVDEVETMVEGVAHVIGAGAHDIAEATKDIIPGQQGGEDVEGLKLDDIAMDLPGAFVEDFGERWGISKFMHGDIFGGLSDVLTGLYERPLSAIGDVLMVGTGAKLAAKAGALGTEAGSLGAKVLGRTGEEGATVIGRGATGARSVVDGVSLTSGKSLALTLSENPVARIAQRRIYQLGQYGGRLPGSGAGYLAQLDPVAELGKFNTAKIGLDLAESAELPLWRPVLSRAIEGRSTSKALSVMGIRQKDKWVPEAQYMAQIVKDLEDSADMGYVKGGMQDDLLGIIHGTDSTLEAPSNAPATHFDPDPELEATIGDTVIEPSEVDVNVLSRLAQKYGKKYGQEGGYERIEKTNPRTPLYAPHLMDGADRSRLLFYVIDMDDVGVTARKIAEDLDGEIVYVKNYFKDTGSYDGYHVGIKTMGPDGNPVITDVNIATRDLAQAQNVWGKLAIHGDALTKEIQAILREASLGTVSPSTVARALRLGNEIEATRALGAETFNFTRRVLNGDAPYDPLLAAADRIRPVVFNAATWREMQRGTLTAAQAMNRAFGPIRATKWSAMMRDLEAEIADLLEGGAANGMKGQDLMPLVANSAEQRLGGGPLIESIFRTKQDWNIPFTTEDNLSGVLRTAEKTIAGDETWLPRGWRDDPARAAQKIVDGLRARTHKAIVENGEVTGFTWKELLQEHRGLQTPQYYPHIKASRLANADAMLSGRKSAVIDSVSPREKKWGGWLYETGRLEKDPVRAYTSLFREIARHEEFANMMTKLVEKYGRLVDEDELASIAGGVANSAQVLVTMRGLTEHVSARAKLMTLTHEGVMAGDDLAEATVKAVQTLLDQAIDDFKTMGRMTEPVYALPSHIAKHIDRAAKLTFGKTFNFYYDSAMNLWKASVLSMSPRWVVNNTLGNLSYMGVAVPRAIKYAISQMLPSRRALMRSILGDAFSGELERDFVHGTLGSTDERLLLRAQDAGILPAQRFAQRGLDINAGAEASKLERAGMFGARRIQGVSRGIRRLNGWIEDAARRGVAIDSIRRQQMLGWESRFWSSKRTLEEISRRGIPDQHEWATTVTDVNKVLGDYLVMSPLEQQIVRRYLMPFYAFYRHTAKFVARMPFEHPLKVRVLQQITEIDRQMQGALPDYMRGAAQIMPGMWLNFNRANPMQAVTEAYLPSLTHPLISLAVQRLTGTNPFGSPYTPGPEDGVFETSSGVQYAVRYGPDGEYLGVKELSGTWQPPLYQAIGSMFPQFALLPGVDVFGRDFARKAAGLAGVPYYGFDQERYAAWKMRDELQAYGRGISAAARAS